MLGILTWSIIALLTVTTIAITVWYLSESVVEEEMKKAASARDVRGSIQGLIDEVADDHAVVKVSADGNNFVNLNINYTTRSSGVYAGRRISSYV